MPAVALGAGRGRAPQRRRARIATTTPDRIASAPLDPPALSSLFHLSSPLNPLSLFDPFGPAGISATAHPDRPGHLGAARWNIGPHGQPAQSSIGPPLTGPEFHRAAPDRPRVPSGRCDYAMAVLDCAAFIPFGGFLTASWAARWPTRSRRCVPTGLSADPPGRTAPDRRPARRRRSRDSQADVAIVASARRSRRGRGFQA
jgi:hypothetical protein